MIQYTIMYDGLDTNLSWKSGSASSSIYHDLPCFIRRIEHFAIHDKTSAYINLG